MNLLTNRHHWPVLTNFPQSKFGLSELKQTKFYQEVFAEGKEEGKLETIPQLWGLGLSIEQIAQALGLDEQVVRQAVQPKL